MTAGSHRIDSTAMRMLAWWARRDLPRAPQLMERAGVWDEKLWQRGEVRECRGVLHGYRMRLDTGDYHQRGAWFYGRLLDVHVQLAMLALLRPGETFVDGGANIGMLSMLAARALGERGRIIAFEPNPAVFEELKWHLNENRLDRVEAHQIGLSDRAARMQLSVPATGNTGAGTLGSRHSGGDHLKYDVEVRPGDDVLRGLQGPLLVKLDVEGHEPAALRGLSGTIRDHRPALIVESNVGMLRGNGTSVAELFEMLGGLGYQPWAMSTVWHRLSRRWKLRLHSMPISWRPTKTQNVVFLQGDGVHSGRIGGLIADLPPRRH